MREKLSKKKIAIVGGGIVAVLAAKILLNRGYRDINIYEKNKDFGGILVDQKFKDEFFFTSCQYLNTDQEWYDHIPKNIKHLELEKFNHIYHSFTEIDNVEIFENNFAGPVFLEKPIFKKKNIDKNLNERLKIYPKKINNFLRNWLFNGIDTDLKNLTSSSSYGLSIRRIMYKNFFSETKRKKKLSFIDETHGLKRDLLKLNPLYAGIPKFGYNSFFSKFLKYLKRNNVKFHSLSPVRTQVKNNKLEIYSKNKKIDYNYILWTGNPTSLIYQTLNKKLDSNHIKSTNFYFKLKIKLKEIFYVQIFSDKIPVNRIFIYDDGKSTKITVESFKTDINIESIKKYIIKVFNHLKIKLLISDIIYYGSKYTKNYSILSTNDQSLIKKFKKNLKRFKIIDCGWELYGRDLKLKQLIKSIDFYTGKLK